MPISFLPYVRTEKLTDIQPGWLKQQNIRLLMLDFDNTIVPYTTDVPTEDVISWFRMMNGSDVPLCVVSNSRRSRVKKFCAAYGFLKSGSRDVYLSISFIQPIFHLKLKPSPPS